MGLFAPVVLLSWFVLPSHVLLLVSPSFHPLNTHVLLFQLILLHNDRLCIFAIPSHKIVLCLLSQDLTSNAFYVVVSPFLFKKRPT